MTSTDVRQILIELNVVYWHIPADLAVSRPRRQYPRLPPFMLCTRFYGGFEEKSGRAELGPSSAVVDPEKIFQQVTQRGNETRSVRFLR